MFGNIVLMLVISYHHHVRTQPCECGIANIASEKKFTPRPKYRLESVNNHLQDNRGEKTEKWRMFNHDDDTSDRDYIIGGKVTRPNAYPWVVFIEIVDDSSPRRCGGSLIRSCSQIIF